MIKYSIRGENIEVTEAIRAYVEQKLSKVEKYFNASQDLNAKINLKVYREKTAKVEVTLPIGAVTLRAEDVSQDLYGSIDLVSDKIERQIRKNKTKIEKKHREKVATGEVFSDNFSAEEVEEAPEITVVRTKNIDLKPMDVDEAILQMELLGHDFFIYKDSEDNTTNIIYKREDGAYGLIEAK